MRYWQTHNYDPVVGRYYDGEEQYARQVKALEEVQVLPAGAPAVHPVLGEGQAYNIVTDLQGPDTRWTAVDFQREPRGGLEEGALIEQGIRKRAEDAADLAAERRLGSSPGRAFSEHQMDGRHHGYDPITNESTGRGSKPLAPSRLRAPTPSGSNSTTRRRSQRRTAAAWGGMGMGTSVTPRQGPGPRGRPCRLPLPLPPTPP